MGNTMCTTRTGCDSETCDSVTAGPWSSCSAPVGYPVPPERSVYRPFLGLAVLQIRLQIPSVTIVFARPHCDCSSATVEYIQAGKLVYREGLPVRSLCNTRLRLVAGNTRDTCEWISNKCCSAKVCKWSEHLGYKSDTTWVG